MGAARGRRRDILDADSDLVETALGTYTPGGVFDVGWWLGLVLIALAAWQPTPVDIAREDRERGWTVALPIAFGVLAAGVLAYGCLRPHPRTPAR